MRVIGGTARGTKLQAVPGDTTRPILDRIKTALFDILRPKISGVTMLDLFSGSGGVAIEALSQGAEHAVMVDLEKAAIETIKKNLQTTRLYDKAEVRHTDAFKFLKSCTRTFDFIYIAPPQYKGLWIEAIHYICERPSILSPEGFIVVQIDPKEDQNIQTDVLSRTDERSYGKTKLIFFTLLRNQEQEPEQEI